MNLRSIVIATCLTGLTVTAGATWVIHDHYQRTLQRELAESTGQVGKLRVQAQALQVEQADRRRELDAIRGEITRAEVALADAQAAAEDSRCLATRARVDATVMLEQVQCYKLLADHAGCLALRERTRAGNTMLGVLVGAGAAIVTGGSSLLLTAGGGLVGASSGGSRQCPAPSCVLEPRKLRRRALAQEGLRALPVCRGEYEAILLTDDEGAAPELETIERELLGGPTRDTPRPHSKRRRPKRPKHRR